MYNKRITREHRTAFILLCDRSGSMSEKVTYGGRLCTKADAVATIINMFLEEVASRCKREDGVRDYFDIAVVEYSGRGVRPLLSADNFITVPDLIRLPAPTQKQTILRILPSGNQTASVVFRRNWIEPAAEGNTPMGAALQYAHNLVKRWCARTANRASFPPVVINITDGEASDADAGLLSAIAADITRVSTDDGNVLLFNIHLGGGDSPGQQVSFPSAPSHLPQNRYAALLYKISSVLPACYDEMILASAPGTSPPYRAMSFNCSLDELFSMLAIGSLSASIE